MIPALATRMNNGTTWALAVVAALTVAVCWYVVAHVQTAPSGFFLSDAEVATRDLTGTWSELVRPSVWLTRYPLVLWLLAIELLSFLAYPLVTFPLFRGLADRGWAFSKLLGILLPAFVAWQLSSLGVAPFNEGTLVSLVGLMMVAGAVAFFARWRDIRDTALGSYRAILVTEAVFLTAFCAYAAYVYFGPGIYHSFVIGETPLNMSVLMSVLKSEWMPPQDVWLSGTFTNYYYFGYVPFAALIRMTYITPDVSYGLSVATCFALTACMSYSVVHTLAVSSWGRGSRSKVILAGLLAAGLPMVANMAVLGGGVLPLMADLANGGSWQFVQDDYLPTIINGITPLFSFAVVNLHPAETLYLPYLLLVVGVCAVVLIAHQGDTILPPRWYANVLVLGGASGLMYAVNVWAYPHCLLLSILTLAYVEWRVRADWSWPRLAIVVSLKAGAVIGISLLTILPFLLGLHTGGVALSFAPIDGLTMSGLVFDWGPLLAVVAVYCVFRLNTVGNRGGLFKVVVVPASAVVFFLLLFSPLAFLFLTGGFFLLLLASMGVLVCRSDDRAEVIVLLMASVGVVGVLTNMLVRVEEAPILGSSLTFLNSMSKSVTVMYALLYPSAVWMVWRLSVEQLDKRRGVIALAIVIVLSATLVSAVFGVARVLSLETPGGASMNVVNAVRHAELYSVPKDNLQYSFLPDRWIATIDLDRRVAAQGGLIDDPSLWFRDDAHSSPFRRHEGSPIINVASEMEAVDWLRDNVVGSPVILEAYAYRGYNWSDGARISTLTGLPTVLGSEMHMTQHRWEIRESIRQRTVDISRIYSSDSLEEAHDLLEKYGVRLVFVGEVERLYYPGAGLDKFQVADWATLVYENAHVEVWEVEYGRTE